MKRYLLVIFLLQSALLQAQDFTFSQFYESPMLRNPGLAGVFDGDARVSGNFRNQWQSVTMPYRTGAASAEFQLFVFGKDYLTLGLQATYDEAGDIKLKRSSLLPGFNYHKLLFDNGTYLQIGAMGGPVSNQFDPTKAKYGDQWVNGSYDPSNSTQQQFNRTGINYFDASAGVSVSGNAGTDLHYYFGGGVFHFNSPQVAFYANDLKTKLKPKLSITTGLNLETSDNNDVTMYADFYLQGGHRQFIAGALYETILNQVTDEEKNNKTAFSVGGLYRYNDALIPVVKLDIYHFSAALSYDVNISKLTTASQFRGGLELSLSYRANFTNGFNSAAARQVECPRPGKGF